MEINTKTLSIVLIALIILIVFVSTVVKSYRNHIDNLYEVVESKIEEEAKKCFMEKKCEGTETTLGNLISLGYIDRQINPVTKEYVSEELVITFDGNECTASIR